MQYILGLLSLAAAAFIWIQRAHTAALMAHRLAGMASDATRAAKRFSSKPRKNMHPIDSIDTPDLALAGLGAAFLELGAMPTREQLDAMISSLAKATHKTRKETEDLVVLARGIVQDGGGAQLNIKRLARKLRAMSGGDRFPQMLEIFQAIARAEGGTLNEQQRSALMDVKEAFDLI